MHWQGFLISQRPTPSLLFFLKEGRRRHFPRFDTALSSSSSSFFGNNRLRNSLHKRRPSALLHKGSCCWNSNPYSAYLVISMRIIARVRSIKHEKRERAKGIKESLTSKHDNSSERGDSKGAAWLRCFILFRPEPASLLDRSNEPDETR